MKKSKVFIVEDEIIAQEVIIDFVQDFGYECVGATGDPFEALEEIEKLKPDLVLLDINLGNKRMNGVDVASKLNCPFVYLTANSDKFTIKDAAQTNYSDFVLKPIDSDRLKVAMNLALAKAKNEKLNGDCLIIQNTNNLIRTPFKQILFIKSLGNYIELHEKSGRKLIRKTLKEVEDMLPDEFFIKTHRSYLVNKAYIEELTASYLLLSGVKIPVSRSFKEKVRESMEKW